MPGSMGSIYFNSRPHEEVDDKEGGHGSIKQYFNSRPHEEVDVYLRFLYYFQCISTHDLTKRSTFISHATIIAHLFQLTTSRRGRLSSSSDNSSKNSYFNSRPHEEVDEGRRDFYNGLLDFNSRPHEEVDGLRRQDGDPLLEFQLTTSRRGRPWRLYGPAAAFHFNSRPHEEVDVMPIPPSLLFTYFNSRPHEEVDVMPIPPSLLFTYFNSRPHEEVDLQRPDGSEAAGLISTHDLTKRSTAMREFPVERVIISTHDLTKRSTLFRPV